MYTFTVHFYGTLLGYTFRVHFYSTLLQYTFRVHFYGTFLGFTFTVHFYGTLLGYTFRVHFSFERPQIPRYGGLVLLFDKFYWKTQGNIFPSTLQLSWVCQAAVRQLRRCRLHSVTDHIIYYWVSVDTNKNPTLPLQIRQNLNSCTTPVWSDPHLFYFLVKSIF